MTLDAFLFWFLSLLVVGCGLAVILFSNPIYSALSLVMTMVGVAAIFVTLNAYFLAGVQLIVYTGAVMVLFVMVLMLFDLKHESQAFSRGKVTGFLKIATVGILAGLLVGAITMGASNAWEGFLSKDISQEMSAAYAANDNTKALSTKLFMENILGFEVLGVLLLVIAIGAVALSRSKGGTHARD